MIEKLGPYRIERVLGRGGMGSVYAGVHEGTGQRAAVKVLSAAFCHDESFRDRFVAEIEVLKKLQHPNIVQLRGDGEQDGCLFYVMELVNGQNLQQELQSGKCFDWPDVVQIGIQVCHALKHAHDRGIIHRDLKPANLLRAGDDIIKLSDFGIAKLFGARHFTAMGSVMGTADYMAPEQAEGRPATGRTDLYSLGAVMFTLLAKRPPFAGPTLPRVIHSLRYEEAPLLRCLAPQAPRELEQIVHQLLRKDPAERVSTALALSKRLEALWRGRGSEDQHSGVGVVPVPARDGSSAADDATRKIEVQADPVTELSPTEVNLPHGPGSAARSPAEVPTGMIRNCPSVGESNRPAAPAESGPSSQVKPNRFTPLDTEGNQPDETASSALPVRRWERLEVGLLAIALLAIVVVVLWAAWPASADTLYRRIRATAKERGIEAAKQQIDEFVERFPADGRFEEVEGMKKDVECDWLQSRLALKDLSSGGSRLEPFERQFLLAMRLKSKDPESARAGFRSLVDEYPISAESPDALRVCVEAARHQLVRLGSGGKPP